MPSVRENIKMWGASGNWREAGAGWSEPWGSPDKQWYGAIFPRIAPFLPVQTILEIAPGFGRWTHFLRNHCERLIGVDLNENCIRTCKDRFGGDESLEFHVNNGVSLGMVADESVDFAFSFDSLVHAEADVIDAYLSELSRVLNPHGTAFLHHSNLGAYRADRVDAMLSRIPVVRHFAWRFGLFGFRPNHHWRAESVSAVSVRKLCQKHCLFCVRQELVNWGADFLNDCFSVISRSPSPDCHIIENLEFMHEAERIRQSPTPKPSD